MLVVAMKGFAIGRENGDALKQRYFPVGERFRRCFQNNYAVLLMMDLLAKKAITRLPFFVETLAKSKIVCYNNGKRIFTAD